MSSFFSKVNVAAALYLLWDGKKITPQNWKLCCRVFLPLTQITQNQNRMHMDSTESKFSMQLMGFLQHFILDEYTLFIRFGLVLWQLVTAKLSPFIRTEQPSVCIYLCDSVDLLWYMFFTWFIWLLIQVHTSI